MKICTQHQTACTSQERLDAVGAGDCGLLWGRGDADNDHRMSPAPETGTSIFRGGPSQRRSGTGPSPGRLCYGNRTTKLDKERLSGATSHKTE
jgi:hypothetical protein